MPRSAQSPESKVLEYFHTAPLDVAEVVLGLAKGAVLGRQPKVRRRRRSKAEMTAAATPRPPAPPVPAAAVRNRYPRPSHKKKAPKPSTAKVEDFSSSTT